MIVHVFGTVRINTIYIYIYCMSIAMRPFIVTCLAKNSYVNVLMSLLVRLVRCKWKPAKILQCAGRQCKPAETLTLCQGK